MYLPTNRHFFHFFLLGPRCQQYSRIANIGQKHGREPKRHHSRPYKHPGMQRNTRHNRAISARRTFCPETGPTRPARQPAPTARKSPGVRRLLTPPHPAAAPYFPPHRSSLPASEYSARRIGTRRGTRQHGSTVRLHNEQDCARSGNEAVTKRHPERHPERHLERQRQPHFPIRTPGTQ